MKEVRNKLGQSLLILSAFVAFVVVHQIVRNPFVDSAGIYWEWKRDMVGNRTVAHLEKGLVLLAGTPSHESFYSAISGLCVDLEMESECYEQFIAADVWVDPSRAPLIDYALGRLAMRTDSALSADHVLKAASSARLTPRLARFIVDDAEEGRLNLTLDALRTLWSTTKYASYSEQGQIFGYAYIQIRSNNWEAAEDILVKLAEMRPNNVEAYRELGRIYFSIGNRELCFHVTNQALEISIANRDREGELNALGNLAYLHLRWDSASDDAKEKLLDVVNLAERIGDPSAVGINSFRLGEIEARRAQYESALTYMARAEEMKSHIPVSFMVQILSTRGEIFRRQLRYDESVEALAKAKDLIGLHGLHASHHSIAVDAYLAQVYWDTGRLDVAIGIAERSIARADSLGLIDSMIAMRGILGQMYMDHVMLDESIIVHSEALDLAIEDGSTYRIYDAYIDLGFTYACMMNVDEAQRYFTLGMNVAMAEFDSVAIGKAMVGVGITYSSVGNYELADSYFDQALGYYEKHDVPKLIGQVYQWLAEVSRQRRDLESANAYLSRAEEYAFDDGMRFEIQRLRGEFALLAEEYHRALAEFESALRIAHLPLHAWRSRMGRALALWKLSRHSEAAAEFETAMNEVEYQRQTQLLASDRSLMAAGSYDLYELYASFLEAQARYEDAIHIDERGRSRTLLDLLFTTQQARGKADGIAVERAIAARMRSHALSLEEAELLAADNQTGFQSDRLEEIGEEQRTVERQFGDLQRDLLGSNPLYAFAPAGTDAIQRMLRPEEAIVLYSLRGESLNSMGSSVAYVIRPDRIAFVPLRHDPAALDESVRFFRDAITDSQRGPGSNWESTAGKLYEWLIAPILPFLRPETTQLHVVPDGALHYLPFAALQDGQNSFLVERFDLSYSPSLTVLKLSREQNPMKWSRMLLFADPDEDLPGARHEAGTIAAKRPGDRRLVLGEDATQKLLEREAPEYDIIHFATHGAFRSRTPLASQIKLFDDFLTVDEIGELNLDAYLVTLSACETALSGGLMHDSAPGEEWVGLYQAFLAAGTPTVLASLWTIHDRYSGALMSRFYDHLETTGKARALAEVQRGFITDQRMSHPYYWAAFSVLGDPL
jgi:CHAT domain-containing protein/Flp pilus assembly protein TadD